MSLPMPMSYHQTFHALARQFIDELEGPPTPEEFFLWLDLPSNHHLQHRIDATLLAFGPGQAAMDGQLLEFVDVALVEWTRWKEGASQPPDID